MKVPTSSFVGVSCVFVLVCEEVGLGLSVPRVVHVELVGGMFGRSDVNGVTWEVFK